MATNRFFSENPALNLLSVFHPAVNHEFGAGFPFVVMDTDDAQAHYINMFLNVSYLQNNTQHVLTELRTQSQSVFFVFQ